MLEKDKNNKNKLLYDPNQQKAKRLGAFSMEENQYEDPETEEDVTEEETEEVNEEENYEDNNEFVTNETVPSYSVNQIKNASAKIASDKLKKKFALFITTHPWVLVVAGILILAIIVILIFISPAKGRYDSKCDFNLTQVYYHSPVMENGADGSDGEYYGLKEFVLGTTAELIDYEKYSKNVVKAIMIVLKTNILSIGGYSHTEKNVDITTVQFNFSKLEEETDIYKDLESIYLDIENELYLYDTYKGTIENLTEDNSLDLNSEIIDDMVEINGSYKTILNTIYNTVDEYEEETEEIKRYKIYSLEDHCEYIIEDEENNGICDLMSLNHTSLSRSEFINRIQELNIISIFKENAGKIYDIATQNNINPELVVVRASAEGFSPYVKGYPGYNNFWGLGCYNGEDLSTCSSYPSFDAGVQAFVKNIAKYEDLHSMMMKYAYIGSGWFNPGSSGMGGCYYYPYIKEYLSSSRAIEVGNACASSKPCSGKDCLATTEEDQNAYANWQVKQMADIRQSYFKIGYDACDSYYGACEIFKQGDSKWGSISLGKSSSNMASSGCAVTSIAIGIACSGVSTTISDFDAGKFIKELNDNSCFTDEGYIYWGCSGISKVAPSVSLYTDVQGIKNYDINRKKDLITSYDSKDSFLLLHFENAQHLRGHYVVFSDFADDNVLVKDPAVGKISKVKINEIDRIIVYKIDRSAINE